MKIGNESMFSKIEKPSSADRIAESEENKGLVNRESAFDYNKISQAIGKSGISPESLYEDDYPEKNPKEVVDESTGEEAIIGQIDERLKEDKDPYDFRNIISVLLQNIFDKKVSENVKNEEARKLLKKANDFLAEYQSILKKGLSPEEEYQTCQGVFQRIVGDVAYIKDGKARKVELLSRYTKVKEAQPGARGYKIFYDRFGNGYLTKEEARVADKKPGKQVIRTTSRRIEV